MIIVIALGGNALTQPGKPVTTNNLRTACDAVAMQIAGLSSKHDIVLVHGNGPQIGALALQAEHQHQTQLADFDILSAESQGMIGYMLQQALKNAIPSREVVTILTQVVVDADDPGFAHPSKPIGAYYNINLQQQLETKHPNWHFQKTAKGIRRIIASPEPKIILELASIAHLLKKHIIVIAAGGGGIPCVNDKGSLCGIEAVIDKDLTASLLARSLCADRFIILTNVDGIYKQWGEKHQVKMKNIAATQLANMTFQPGSMQPKVQAACEFSLSTQKLASIGNLLDLKNIFNEAAGTHVFYIRDIKPENNKMQYPGSDASPRIS